MATPTSQQNQFKLQRDLAFISATTGVLRLKEAVQQKKPRRVRRLVDQAKELLATATERQTFYMAQMGIDLSNEEEANKVSYLQDEAVAEIEDALDALADLGGEVIFEDAKRSLNLKLANIRAGLDGVVTSLGDQPAGPHVVELAREDLARFMEFRADAIGMFENVVMQVESSEMRRHGEDYLAERAHDANEHFKAVRHALAPFGGSSSRGSSPACSGSGNSQEQGIKAKKFEFPKFDGDVRRYAGFKRDFQNVAAKARIVDEWELSLRLRQDCLEGRAKELCINLEEYQGVWRKLDEVFDDPLRVVAEVNAQLESIKQLSDRDYAGFIHMVDVLEKGSVDLKSANQLAAISNPFTLQMIESRCPEWIQRDLVVHKRENNIGADGFEAVLGFLLLRRTDARRLLNTMDRRGSWSGPSSRLREMAHSGGAQARAGPPRRASVNVALAHEDREFTCLVPECRERKHHFLSRCAAWAARDPKNKAALVGEKSLCCLCFSPHHGVDDCAKRGRWRECGIGGCTAWHHRSLHGGDIGLVSLAALSDSQVCLQMEHVKLQGGLTALTLWDSGSDACLITHDLAEVGGFKGSRCPFALTGITGATDSRSTRAYRVPLIDVRGRIRWITAYGVPTIASAVNYVNLSSPTDRPDECLAVGEIQLVVGMSFAGLHPVFHSHRGAYIIYRSNFGSGWTAAGGQ